MGMAIVMPMAIDTTTSTRTIATRPTGRGTARITPVITRTTMRTITCTTTLPAAGCPWP